MDEIMFVNVKKASNNLKVYVKYRFFLFNEVPCMGRLNGNTKTNSQEL